MAIIIDFSGIAISGVFAISDQLIGKSEDEYVGMVRHTILSSILMHKRNYTKEYGETIIACDGPTYWRKRFFPYYKANRKKAREASDLDWTLIFKAMNAVRDELKLYFPYRHIYLELTEADDVIACLTKYFRTEFGSMQKVMIISSDNDMAQLQKYDGVSQFSPITKKSIKLSKTQVKEYVNMSTVKGQVKDGIPSIKQSDDELTKEDRKRAPTISQKLLNEFMEKGIDACKDEFERKNYIRNQNLFNFDFIPEEIYDNVIAEYEKPKTKKFDRMELMNYLIKNKCRQLLTSLEDF